MPRNLLSAETSPYLLQHKDNPVHWRPWGETAFDDARRLDRPILLSIGYAACHWCHVMAHESFEDDAVAAVVNELFVPVKVDREERPDVDALYQAALATLGEHGGWPLTMFLTPAGEPFWGGTYFPPAPRFGRPAFTDVCRQIAAVYRGDRERISANAAAIRENLERLAAPTPGSGLGPAAFEQTALNALRLVDPLRGGTSGAPKFPQPVFFRFLWRAYRRTRSPMFREAVLLTLDRMCQGGIYDHLAGGFARYSTDAEWLVPHFEKMLYDNALLIDLLTEVWRDAGGALYADRVRETVEWLFAEMRVEAAPGSAAFAGALDADSEGEEGRYYVWTEAEIDAELGSASARFKRAYDVAAEGNWEGRVILNRSGDAIQDAPEEKALAEARATLLAARRRRVPPGRDDKVLADWNALLAAALARAAVAFDRPDWLDAARATFRFVRTEMDAGDGRLRHAWRGGRAAHPATLEDYANLAEAALALRSTTGDEDYLAEAERLVAVADRHFWDAAHGGYFLAADDVRNLIVRTKSFADNATPSGNGVMMGVLARLFLLTGRDDYAERAERLAVAFSSDDPRQLLGLPGLLAGAEILERAVQVVIVGDPADQATAALRDTARRAAPPIAETMFARPGDALPSGHPAAGKTATARPTAYVCERRTCSAPITDAGALRRVLEAL